jgi:hypothetical protein
MSEENDRDTPETPEPAKDQTPPGTPWPEPNKTTDFGDKIPSSKK